MKTKVRAGATGRAAAGTRAAIALGENRASGGTPRINPKWAWHYSVLLKLRDRLARGRAEQQAASAEPLERHSMDMADSATDEYDHDLALSKLSANQDSLIEVEDAIRRILSGTYGICERTGRPIPAARLKAVPWTRFTREAELQLEKEGAIGRAQLGTLGSVRDRRNPPLAHSAAELETGERKKEIREKSEPSVDEEEEEQ